MANIPKRNMDTVNKNYQMVILAQDRIPWVLTQTLKWPSTTPPNLKEEIKLVKEIFLQELKTKLLGQQFYTPHVKHILDINNLPELIDYDIASIFGYIIQDITDPVKSVTLDYRPIQVEED